MEIALQVKDLSCTLGGNQILSDLSFSVAKGEYVSIVGHNGSGKSTLIKSIIGVIKRQAGSVEINEKPRDSYKRRDLARIVSYVPQKTSLELAISVEEFVLLARYPYLPPLTMITTEDREIAMNCLKLVEMCDFSDRMINTLSGGELQKVVVASALAQEPEIILLDEPVSFLDPKYQIEIYRLLHKINREQNITIIEVTHEINSAARFADKILALKDGKIIFFDESEKIMTEENLLEIFDTSFVIVDHPQLPGKLAIPAANPDEVNS